MKIEYVPIKDIRPYPHNPRKNDATIEKVRMSLEKFGWQQPIVVDKAGVIIVGHTRYAAAKEAGYQRVPVVKAVELNDRQVRAYRIMDNKAHDWTRWDRVELKYELDDFEDLDITGFTLKELDEILYPEAGLVGNESKYKSQHHVIVECNSEEDLIMIEEHLTKKGFGPCRKNMY